MQFATSIDGTKVAFDKTGNGPALILVHGALASRADHAELAQLLSPHFTVYNYDRRGHGNTPDNGEYISEREIEDIAAIIEAAGGTAFIHGRSSGACLALEAAASLGDKIKKLAIYEAPYDEAAGAAEKWTYKSEIDKLLAQGRYGEAVEHHMKFVGAPAEMITEMKASPKWPASEAMAPTLAYDIAAVGNDRAIPDRAANIKAITLVMDGSASLEVMPFMRRSAEKLTSIIPNARHHVIEGEGHGVSSEKLAPVLVEFFEEKSRNL